jgi:hypothetical protein
MNPDKTLFFFAMAYSFTPSVMPFASPTRACISEGIMILVALPSGSNTKKKRPGGRFLHSFVAIA